MWQSSIEHSNRLSYFCCRDCAWFSLHFLIIVFVDLTTPSSSSDTWRSNLWKWCSGSFRCCMGIRILVTAQQHDQYCYSNACWTACYARLSLFLITQNGLLCVRGKKIICVQWSSWHNIVAFTGLFLFVWSFSSMCSLYIQCTCIIPCMNNH